MQQNWGMQPAWDSILQSDAECTWAAWKRLSLWDSSGGWELEISSIQNRFCVRIIVMICFDLLYRLYLLPCLLLLWLLQVFLWLALRPSHTRLPGNAGNVIRPSHTHAILDVLERLSYVGKAKRSEKQKIERVFLYDLKEEGPGGPRFYPSTTWMAQAPMTAQSSPRPW